MEAWITIYGGGLIAVLGAMVVLYAVALAKDDYSIVDIFWGLGFVLLSRVTLALGSEPNVYAFLFNLLILLWGLRLSTYLWMRNRGKGEDYRYTEMRESWGPTHRVQAFFKVFMLQGFLIWFIGLPISKVNAEAFTIVQWHQWFGLALGFIGLIFETIADWQMANFKRDPANKGKVMDSGLWRYSRHPNYFGETLVWWGVFLVAVQTFTDLWLAISPVMITFLLLKVSGISLLEQKLNTKPKYQDYVDRTSAFVPLPPKRK